MGIFSANQHSHARRKPMMAENDGPGSRAGLRMMCDGCHAARATVEVVTEAGSIFLCQHHYKKHMSSIIAAGYQVRGRLGS